MPIHRYQTVVDDQIVQAAEPLTKGVRSFYYDYDQADQAITRYTLDRLVRAADGRSVIIVTIPFKRDLLNLRDRGAPPLPAWFRQMSKVWASPSLTCCPFWQRVPATGKATITSAIITGRPTPW